MVVQLLHTELVGSSNLPVTSKHTEEYMRGYFLTNMYLSSIQHGIQAAHCLQEINNNFPGNEILTDWAENHKTMYVLNGGTSE